jgi:hypothetical protein
MKSLLFGIIISIFFNLLSTFSFAQYNLVPNGSFENYNWCPSGIGNLNAVSDWDSPDFPLLQG